MVFKYRVWDTDMQIYVLTCNFPVDYHLFWRRNCVQLARLVLYVIVPTNARIDLHRDMLAKVATVLLKSFQTQSPWKTARLVTSRLQAQQNATCNLETCRFFVGPPSVKLDVLPFASTWWPSTFVQRLFLPRISTWFLQFFFSSSFVIISSWARLSYYFFLEQTRHYLL